MSSVKGHNNQEAERNHCADGNKWMMFQHEREKRDVLITGCGIIVLDGLVSGDDHRRLCEIGAAPEWMSEQQINDFAEQMLVV